MGPRPALPAEVATYNDYQRQRLLVKPGMTCYWQTRRNRDSITFDEWVDLDLWVTNTHIWASRIALFFLLLTMKRCCSLPTRNFTLRH